MADKKPLVLTNGSIKEIGAGDTVPISNGGTGATTATAALNALLPSQTGNNTKVLGTDGTNTSWVEKGQLTPRVQSVTSAATVTPNANSDDLVDITAQAVALTLAAPSGTPVNGQVIEIRIKDNGVVRAITWNAIYRAFGLALPTSTTAGKTIYASCVYNSAAVKWDTFITNEL